MADIVSCPWKCSWSLVRYQDIIFEFYSIEVRATNKEWKVQASYKMLKEKEKLSNEVLKYVKFYSILL